MSFYKKRFELFKEQLKKSVIHFQPVLNLEPGSLNISSWEALARDQSVGHAPNSLFVSAETWGREFTTELDIHFLKLALQSYRAALMEAKMQRPNEIQELSVNVYPDSLMRTAYFDAVKDALHENNILPRKLLLELSEKAPVPAEAGGIRSFKNRLVKFVREIGVEFAIDDFGVEHSSTSRLVELNPVHVKIDRQVLNQPYSDITLRYVLDIVSNERLNTAHVIVEGLDEDSQLSMRQIYDLGIRYVQGYKIGRPAPNIYRLDKELMQLLEGQLVLTGK